MKKLVTFAILIGLVALALKVVAAQRKQWVGLTEPELRVKVDAKLPIQMPVARRIEVTEKVVDAMKGRGLVRSDPGTPA